jgi:hypothetical protein
MGYIENIIFIVSLLLYVHPPTVPLFSCVDPLPQICVLLAMETYLGCHCLAMAVSSGFHVTIWTGKIMLMPVCLFSPYCSQLQM